MGAEEDGAYIIDRRGLPQVDGLRDREVGVPLEGGLHPHVPLPVDLVRRDEAAAHLVRHVLAAGQGAAGRQLLHQLARVEAAVARRLLEGAGDLGQERAVPHPPVVGERVERLDARGGAGDDRDRARRGDARPGGVAVARAAFSRTRGYLAGRVDRALPVREDALLLAERLRSRVRGGRDLAHQPLREVERLLRVVRDPCRDQQIGEAHDPEPDLAVAADRLGDLGQREGARVDDVVEEAHAQRDGLAQRLPVEVAGRLVPEPRDVHRAERARLPGEQRHLAAWVRRLDRAERRRRVGAVDGVEEDHARVAAEPGGAHGLVEQCGGVLAAALFPVARVDEGDLLAACSGLQEGVGDGEREVEALGGDAVVLRVDEGADVGVVDAQDAHVRAVALSALRDEARDVVVVAQHGDGAAGRAVGGGDGLALAAEPGEVEAGAAAVLLDHRRGLGGRHDRLERVLDRQHEAGGEGAPAAAGVHQRRGVGQEAQAGHRVVEALRPDGAQLGGRLEGSDRLGDAGEELLGRLDDGAAGVAQQVAALEDGAGVLGERRRVGDDAWGGDHEPRGSLRGGWEDGVYENIRSATVQPLQPLRRSYPVALPFWATGADGGGGTGRARETSEQQQRERG